jgi:hypothetical protein
LWEPKVEVQGGESPLNEALERTSGPPSKK